MQTSDPEARGVAERAYKTLQRIGAEGQVTAPARASIEVRSHPTPMFVPLVDVSTDFS